MVIQVSDVIKIDSTELNIVLSSNSGLFTPQSHGIKPASPSISCQSGSKCFYIIKNNQLILDKLYLTLYKSEIENPGCGRGKFRRGIKINGVRPLTIPASSFFNNEYHNLDYSINYTGGILVGTGFSQRYDLCSHMQNQSLWGYSKVHELVFNNGQLIRTNIISSYVQAMRHVIEGNPYKIKDATLECIKHHLNTDFEFDYNLFKDFVVDFTPKPEPRLITKILNHFKAV